MYISLHNRSAYSFGTSLTPPEKLVAFAAQHHMPAIGLTDLNGLYGAIPFYQACREASVKPIIGAELDLADGVRITLLARNIAGYGKLCRLVSLYHLRGEPLDPTEVERYADELICLFSGATGDDTSPQNSEANEHILRFLRDAFTHRLYAELAIHRPEDVPAVRRLARIADELDIPVVASCESRCPRREQALTLRALASIGSLTLLDEPHPDKPAGAWHLRTPAEMERLFARRPDALANTLHIADECDLTIELGRNRFPAFSDPDGRTAMQHLRERCIAGCRWRYVDQPPLKGLGGRRPMLDEAISRLDRELAIIEQVHYAEYFLVFDDIVRYCRREGIASLARGSAADSLVCYVLGVSHACPFRFDLPFDRFLNPERAKFSKMADIDLDLPWDRRDQVIRWVYDRWGHDRVAMIGSPNTFHARAAIADLGKVFGLPPHEINRATKLMPRTAAWNAERAIAKSPESRDFPVAEEPYRTILAIAGGMEGLPRHWAMHPCGLVVSPEPLTDLVPVQPSPKGPLVAQYEMEAIEDLGFVKIDLLGQAGLSVLRDARSEILRTDGRDIDLERDIDYADEPTWDMIATGHARGVHHIESPAMTSLLCQCDCRDIDCLTTVVAIIRPGAANQGKKEAYARRHQGLEPPHYVHPSLVPVLEKTYGLMAFEEHILQIAVEFAEMNLGRADVLRRALNKEERAMIEETGAEFRDCARRAGRTEAQIAAVWSQVEGFKGFMFNKAHSAEYAVEAFQGAWLKRRWPAHYLAAVLSNYRGFYANSPTLPQILYVMEALRLGAGFLPPCVNRSAERFCIEYAPPGGRSSCPPSVVDDQSGRAGRETCLHSPSRGQTLALSDDSTATPGTPADVLLSAISGSNGRSPLRSDLPYLALSPRPRVSASPRPLPPLPYGRGTESTFRLPHSAFRISPMIRVPIMHIKGLPESFLDRYLAERKHGPFADLSDFIRRCSPGEAEGQLLLDSGALDVFGLPRPVMFWELRRRTRQTTAGGADLWDNHADPGRAGRKTCLPSPDRDQALTQPDDSTAKLTPPTYVPHHGVAGSGGRSPLRSDLPYLAQSPDLPPVELTEPDTWQVAQREMDLLGFPITIDPLTFLGRDDKGRQIDWSRYIPVAELNTHLGRRVHICGLMVADRINLTTAGDLMKFVTLADRTGFVETLMFPDTYRRFGYLTVANPILAATGVVEPFENRNGFTFRVETVQTPARNEK